MKTFCARPLPCTLLTLTAAVLAAAPLAAQNCFVGDFGVSLGHGTTDTVYAMRPIGFPFALGGVSYTHIHVNDHGFVQLSNAGVPTPLASGSAALYTPTVANFMAGGPKIAPLYSDMTLAGGGECFYRSTPQQCVITWHNVQSYGIPSPRFSFQLILTPDDVATFVYGPGCTNNSTFGGTSASGIVGMTPAGGAAAPAARNLSTNGVSATATTYELFAAANTFDLANNTLRLSPSGPGHTHALLGAPADCATATRYGVGCDNLKLGGVGLPALGNANFQLRAESLPAVAPLAFFAFGTVVQNPGLPLGSLLGMTGCTAYSNADLGIFGGSAAAPAPSGITPTSLYPLGIPASVALVGTTLSAQAIAPSLANPFGLAASNGLELRIGIDGPIGVANSPIELQFLSYGSFTMGSTSGPANEQPARAVTLTDIVYMGRHEVTQAQYQSVMGSNPSYFVGALAPDAARRPVEQVSFDEAVAFCAALTAAERAAGRLPEGFVYRLPTEAEWEYACRAGTTTPWHTGASLTTAQANFLGARANATWTMGQTAAVGSYAPNAFGLYDMHGNVAEWCLDGFAAYTAGAVSDPFVAAGATRVVRGGAFGSGYAATDCRSAVRSGGPSTFRSISLGFRVVLARPKLDPALNMVAISPGTFMMGSMAGLLQEQPVHQVTLTRPFWMGKHEVTQAQYQAVVGSNPSYFVLGSLAPSRPVEQVTWLDAVAYCQALTALEQAAGRVPPGYQYRLPTEAEWEYCCRAGTTTEWNTGTSLSMTQANFNIALGQTAVVGSYAPNAFGLHDMHGNVLEWCLDTYALYAPGSVTDPLVTGGLNRVIRGGSWNNIDFYCRSATRHLSSPGFTLNSIGFRVVLAPTLVP
jgi:formylglycine-generating enzyme required for sulfatase activity